MREPPAGVSAAAVAEAASTAWALGPTSAVHLPVGFGAHHWRVDAPGTSVFATLDLPGPARDAAALEHAYAAAAALSAQGLDFVVAPLPTVEGRCTVALGPGSLSCTPWLDGTAVGDGPLTSGDEAAATADVLRRLHTAAPPPGLPRWRAKVGPDLPDDLRDLTASPWTTGPFGEQARAALLPRLTAVAGWTADYLRLVETAQQRSWVTTHGEPHTANQLRTADRLVLVDWESVALAPRERDLGGLADAGWPGLDADAEMLAMFDLEWRLDEIAQYAAWFARPHAGSQDDVIALEGFLEELSR